MRQSQEQNAMDWILYAKMGLLSICVFLTVSTFSITQIQYQILQIESDLKHLLQKATDEGLSLTEQTIVTNKIALLAKYNATIAENFRKQFSPFFTVFPKREVVQKTTEFKTITTEQKEKPQQEQRAKITQVSPQLSDTYSHLQQQMSVLYQDIEYANTAETILPAFNKMNSIKIDLQSVSGKISQEESMKLDEIVITPSRSEGLDGCEQSRGLPVKIV